MALTGGSVTVRDLTTKCDPCQACQQERDSPASLGLRMLSTQQASLSRWHGGAAG